MTAKPAIHIVATECQPEVEEKFNRWYDDVHIPMLLKFKGMTEVTRYKIARESSEYPKYFTIYKFESGEAYEAYRKSPELAAAVKEAEETWQGKGYKIIWRVQYEPMRTWKR